MSQMQAGTNGTAPGASIKPKSDGQLFADWLATRKDALAAVLPRHLTADRLLKLALAAGIRQPKIFKCTRESVWLSLLTAAQLGLDCGGALGSAYLVPFNNNKKDANGNWQKVLECQLIIGYRGMIDLARRSGQIESIKAVPVFKGDTFTVVRGIDDTIEHVPDPNGSEDPKSLAFVYCVAKFKGGGYHLEVMSRKQVDMIRAKSKSKDDGPWVTDYVQMALKTVVRRAFKWLPMSIELQTKLDEIAEKVPDAVGDIIDSTASEVVNTETGEVTEDNGGSSDQPEETAQLTEGQGNTAPPIVTPQSELAGKIRGGKKTVTGGSIDADFGG